MVAVALLLLVSLGRTYAIFAMIIIGREITISALREWMAQMGKRGSVAVATIGKFKTTAQMIAIFLLLIGTDKYNDPFYLIGNILMFIASVFDHLVHVLLPENGMERIQINFLKNKKQTTLTHTIKSNN